MVVRPAAVRKAIALTTWEKGLATSPRSFLTYAGTDSALFSDN